MRMRRGTAELQGVAGPGALLSARAGASASVCMATAWLREEVVVAAGGPTEGGGARGPAQHQDTRRAGGGGGGGGLEGAGPCWALHGCVPGAVALHPASAGSGGVASTRTPEPLPTVYRVCDSTVQQEERAGMSSTMLMRAGRP